VWIPEFTLNSLMDLNHRVAIWFINELLNLNYTSIYIAKTLMDTTVVVEDDTLVDWAYFLTKDLEELKHLDLQKKKTYISPHLYMLLALVPKECLIFTPLEVTSATTSLTPLKKTMNSLLSSLKYLYHLKLGVAQPLES